MRSLEGLFVSLGGMRDWSIEARSLGIAARGAEGVSANDESRSFPGQPG